MLSRLLDKPPYMDRFKGELTRLGGSPLLYVAAFAGLGLVTVHLNDELAAYKIAYHFRRPTTLVSVENGHYCVKIYDNIPA